MNARARQSRLSVPDQGLLTLPGDVTGHGIGPALFVAQMHPMLQMAFRLGADLSTAFPEVNDQLAATLTDDRFITGAACPNCQASCWTPFWPSRSARRSRTTSRSSW